MKMNEYRVYFEQVNATYIEVRASSETAARMKAADEWKRDTVSEMRITEVDVIR